MRLIILTARTRYGKIYVASVDQPTGTEAFWNLYFELDGKTWVTPEQVEPTLWAAIRRAYEIAPL